MCAIMLTALAVATAAAPDRRGQNFQIDSPIFSNGGVTLATSASFQLSATVGEAVVGSAAGPNFEVSLGFWADAVADDGIEGDFDGDGDVDLSDFALFVQCYGGAFQPPATSCQPGVDADLDDDGDVDLSDFAIFGQNYTGPL